MKDLYIEGVAIRGGPESCVGVREGVGEALTGVVRAGLSSRERPSLGCRRRSKRRKATSLAALFASRQRTPRGRRTRARIEVSMFENREIPRSPVLVGCGAGRGGKAEAVIP
jgi:hypothetical protein